MSADHMRIRDLKIVVALFEAGNMTQAAKRLGVSEPALSKQLHIIELRAQVRLFERDNGGIKITDSGRSFVAYAKDSIHAFQEAVHEAHEARHGELHKLKVGLSAWLPLRWIQLVQSIELHSYRNLSIEVIFADSMDLLGQLDGHQLDLALVTSPPENASNTSICVARDPFMIALRETHPLAARKSLTLSDVTPHPWIFFHRDVHPPLHDLILQQVVEGGAQARIVHRVNRADQAVPLLSNPAILAWLMPDGAELVMRESFVRIPLVDSRLSLETHLVAKANNKSPLVSEYFRAFVKRIEEDRSPVQLPLPIGG